MKVSDIYPKFKVKKLLTQNDLDAKAAPITKLPAWNDPKYLNIGASKHVSAQSVVVKSTSTGQVYGKRSLYQKTA
jgi:hypothetical protein